MSHPSAQVRRHFVSWEEPWLPQAVRRLASAWSGKGPLDLSDTLAIVPTRQAGRRLREALASQASERGHAVFAPRVLTPDALVGQDPPANVATRLESLLAWTEVFRAVDLADFRAVFPVDPPVRNFPWALRLAQEFNRLQVTLATGGVLLGDVVGRAGAEFVEAERWQQIAVLEQLHAAVLAERGRKDPHAAKLAAADQPPGGLEFRRVAVLAVPDLQPLAVRRLSAIARRTAVDVIVFAPESLANAFDDWGRPMASEWETRILELPEFAQRVHLAADPAAQAARVAELAECYPPLGGALALGVADPEITPLLENELRRRSRAAFNPEGRTRRSEGLFHLLTNLAALARDPAFSTVEALARCPDFFAYLAAKIGPRFAVTHWLEGLDELRARHLPADLGAAREHAAGLRRWPDLPAALEAVAQVREHLRGRSFAAGAAGVLREIFGGRRRERSREDDAAWLETAEAWMDVVRECATLEAQFPAVTAADWWDLALRMFGEGRRVEDKREGALELQGWLELLWEDAPHLVVAGLNDGRVPEAIVENAFLPETLRRTLGLETSVIRFARDAYMLHALAGSRRQGRLELLFGKTSAAGEPLRPSRLLLRCADDELPERIRFLFRAPELGDANASWTRTWKLAPRAAPPPERVAVTALRRYLECPFRFYLRNVLGMQSVDPLKSELDAFDFGTLCHSALEQIGLSPHLRDCVDAAVLRGELLQHLDATVRARYGRELSLPLLVQVESARQRLAKLAELQAAERAAGWRIEQVERPFEIEICGLVVRGKIDRIDRHTATGQTRVIDYKTSDTPVTPAQAHLRALRPGERVAEWASFDAEGKSWTWTDLQLPLYLRAIADLAPERAVAGYFNLPKAAGETTLSLWEDYTLELHGAAMRCAEGACAAIRAGKYWPPNEDVRAERDECAALFHHGVEDSVTWRTA